MYLEYYLMGIILLPGIILAIYAQSKVSRAYNEYSQVFAQSGVKANQLIRRLLDVSGLNKIQVKSIQATLGDNYNPQTEEISLSSGVYDSSSISALGIACHEFGHALQKKEKYVPYEIRRILVPVTNIVSQLLWPLVIIGLIFNLGASANSVVGDIFLWSGIGLFGFAVLFNLATLPVEFNASNRAIKILKTTGTLNDEELAETKEVLNAAALTYVAALLVSVLNLLRFLIVVLGGRNRN
jgi:Zn-dependent membrane protease YugP